MRILFVCQQYIHAERWINQLKDTNHEIYVFDCLDRPVSKGLEWTNFIGNWGKRKLPYFKGEHFIKKRFPKLYNKIERFLKVRPEEKLEAIIQEIQPDLVHSLEMQSQTYHVLPVRKKIKFQWAYFSWGSDLFLYQNDKIHLPKIKEVLRHLDYFFADNTRDIKLAKQLGFQKEDTHVFPGGGGYQLKHYAKYLTPLQERKTILIKGYHHWAGRALFVLEALVLLKDELSEYDIYVYSAHQVVVERIEALNHKFNMNIAYTTRRQELSHEELLSKFGRALLAIGNSISDGIPNTLLEAIICGAFPIQSNPGGVSEDYIEDGINGYLIQSPESKEEIANHIKNALSDQELLANAFEKNQERAKTLAYQKIQEQVIDVYKNIEERIYE